MSILPSAFSHLIYIVDLLVTLQRKTSAIDGVDKSNSGSETISNGKLDKPEQAEKNSSLVFGYLNLFSDGVVSMCSFVIYQRLEKRYFI